MNTTIIGYPRIGDLRELKLRNISEARSALLNLKILPKQYADMTLSSRRTAVSTSYHQTTSLSTTVFLIQPSC